MRAHPGDPAGTLHSLLGHQRAAILRRLDAPKNAGQIADELYTVPSGATYQLRMLEAAGLVRRFRRGRNMIVERTGRGTALLALYEAP